MLKRIKDAAFVERALRHGLPDSPALRLAELFIIATPEVVYCNIFRQDTDASAAMSIALLYVIALTILIETTMSPTGRMQPRQPLLS